jgi:glyoxylase-like metal-dependent hydrolase (beta-lactamase superfamily II)
MSLGYKVFLHSYLGFRSNSTLFYGERDAVLIDASQLLSDAHRLAAEIIPMRKNLTHIYVTHFHPDHHFGLGVLAHAFPKAKIVAPASVVRDIVFTSLDKVDLWASDRLGPEIPPKTTIPMPLHELKLELEGEEILFYDNWDGDSVNNSIVWVPSLRVVCAADIAFHDCHLWTAESNVERRPKWKKDVRRLLEFDPRVVIPGHCDPSKLTVLQEAMDDRSRRYTDSVDWTLSYLDVYEDAYGSAKSGADLAERINKHFGYVKDMDYGVQWQARLLFPRSCPEWFAELPGEPGHIFLNPSGGYDGDPPRE